MMVRGYIPAPRPVDMIYAPIDLAVALAEGLSRKGHKVDFFGPLGTRFRDAHVNVHNLNLRPLVHNQQETTQLYTDRDLLTHYVPALWDSYFVNDMLSRAKRGLYDVLHFHHAEVVLSLAKKFSNVPIVYTLHDPILPWFRELFELYQSPNQHFISISENQRRDAPDLSYLANIYNGTNAHRFSFSAEHEDYLLCVGRIVPEKGIKEAVHIARATGNRLLIIGPVYPDSQDYFDQYIKPYLNDKILYLGFIEHAHLPKYYQKAKAMLTPVQWEEPFGLTSIEAMACGTPVISLRRGAAPEIIKDSKTGFIVDSIAEMIAAVENIDQINRRDCRTHVQNYFSIDKMVDAYEQAYLQLLHPLKKILHKPKFLGRRLQLQSKATFGLKKPHLKRNSSDTDEQTSMELE